MTVGKVQGNAMLLAAAFIFVWSLPGCPATCKDNNPLSNCSDDVRVEGDTVPNSTYTVQKENATDGHILTTPPPKQTYYDFDNPSSPYDDREVAERNKILGLVIPVSVGLFLVCVYIVVFRCCCKPEECPVCKSCDKMCAACINDKEQRLALNELLPPPYAPISFITYRL